MLKEAGITGIITSPAIRTNETAKPLAMSLGIMPKVDTMNDAKALVNTIRALPGGGNVLVVGHTDTIPELLTALGSPSTFSIGETEFDNLFVVTPGQGTHPRILRLRYRR